MLVCMYVEECATCAVVALRSMSSSARTDQIELAALWVSWFSVPCTLVGLFPLPKVPSCVFSTVPEYLFSVYCIYMFYLMSAAYVQPVNKSLYVLLILWWSFEAREHQYNRTAVQKSSGKCATLSAGTMCQQLLLSARALSKACIFRYQAQKEVREPVCTS